MESEQNNHVSRFTFHALLTKFKNLNDGLEYKLL